jgi:ribulose 1,5-bisphosphate synthetase/thiazole synthase
MTMQGDTIAYQPEIVVAGGGTAGCAAAIAAARRGRKVLLVEEANALGGTSTTGGVNEWFAALDGLGDIWDDFLTEIQQFGARFGRFYNPEYAKIVWQLMAEQAGVEILFHASVIGAQTTERPRSDDLDHVAFAQVASCSHVLHVPATVFIDATGEGDLAWLAGAEAMQGHPETGRTLHMSLTFILQDTGKPVPTYLPAGLTPIESEAELPGLHGGLLLPDGRVYCNMTKVMGHDPTDPFSLSHAELEARRQIARIVHYLQRTRFPTYALCASGGRIGIREGRRIVGDYVLTETDIMGDAPHNFEDGVTIATCQIDFHSLTKPGHTGWRQRVEPYAIPYRALTVRGFENLLVAGKCISGDQVAQSSYRMTPTCCAMGQAAGTAAAMTVAQGLGDVRDVDLETLRTILRGDGMVLDPNKHRAFAPEITPDPTRGA